ncbi:hypothetical protein [Pseudaminobacter soli (ex Li et al. 2025)]|uniref:Uncharacterized protein n=1 Tax=Pseudaminobacter soli (ex Li et al. 2025) TaxID=1295366 RepID=A0A2P7SCT5_9HYPH|nr:hypothetical protein [Mesorhizobium soli]PSJ60299.1 hypothetical protein C7I85_14170 [Mesorhizobium soli]
MKTDQDSSDSERIIALEARVAALEKLVRELQQSILQSQAGTTAKPAERPLRSRGMMDRP